jgi:hypothetical protein
MTRWSAITRTRRSCSALAYGSRSTAAAEKSSTGSHTTNGDATASRSRRMKGSADHAIAEPRKVAAPKQRRYVFVVHACGLFASQYGWEAHHAW